MKSTKSFKTSTVDSRPSDLGSLDFRPLTLADVPRVRQLLEARTSRTCDFTVGGIFMWIDWFRYTWCDLGDTLFIKGVVENDRRRAAFSMPIGAMPMDRAVQMVYDHCRHHRLRPVFTAVPEDSIVAFEPFATAAVQELDGWADYLYDAQAIATLRGKAYNKKRNHVNRFKTDNPNWRAEAINDENTHEIISTFVDMCAADPVRDTMASYEREQTLHALVHRAELGFDGLLLRDNDAHIVAFTMGEVAGDTLYVHIEKMSHSTPGSGETIAHLFAAEMLDKYPQIKYINREEDVNDPGLQRAKLSYHPTDLLHKYNLYL